MSIPQFIVELPQKPDLRRGFVLKLMDIEIDPDHPVIFVDTEGGNTRLIIPPNSLKNKTPPPSYN